MECTKLLCSKIAYPGRRVKNLFCIKYYTNEYIIIIFFILYYNYFNIFVTSQNYNINNANYKRI